MLHGGGYPLHSSTEEHSGLWAEKHCGLCVLYSDVDLPSWVKTVTNEPSADTNEEVHTVVHLCAMEQIYRNVLMVQVEELPSCCYVYTYCNIWSQHKWVMHGAIYRF